MNKLLVAFQPNFFAKHGQSLEKMPTQELIGMVLYGIWVDVDVTTNRTYYGPKMC